LGSSVISEEESCEAECYDGEDEENNGEDKVKLSLFDKVDDNVKDRNYNPNNCKDLERCNSGL